MRILFASPAYWPAHAFGGPVVVARELVARLAARGHDVEVLTTTLTDVAGRSQRRTRVETVDGARVTYLATPLRYRWMGITPTLPLELHRLPRADVTHVMGFRDPVTTGVAAWCRVRRVPYLFEPVGMFAPRLRKVALKRLFDSTVTRGVASGARLVVVSSTKERHDVVAAGVDPRRVRATSIRLRASCPTAPRSSSTSAGSRPRRASSTSWRLREGSPTSTWFSPAPTTGTGRWRSSRPRRRTRGQAVACISSRPRRARPTTSTGGRMCSSSP